MITSYTVLCAHISHCHNHYTQHHIFSVRLRVTQHHTLVFRNFWCHSESHSWLYTQPHCMTCLGHKLGSTIQCQTLVPQTQDTPIIAVPFVRVYVIDPHGVTPSVSHTWYQSASHINIHSITISHTPWHIHYLTQSLTSDVTYLVSLRITPSDSPTLHSVSHD